MGTHYQGSSAERQALSVYIKLMRAACEAVGKQAEVVEDDDVRSRPHRVGQRAEHLVLRFHAIAESLVGARVGPLEKVGIEHGQRDAVHPFHIKLRPACGFHYLGLFAQFDVVIAPGPVRPPFAERKE